MSLELVNEENNKYNILFSDLFGTLVADKGDFEFYKLELEKLSPIINSYLSLNNFLVIVTSAHHDSFACLCNVLKLFSDKVSEQYKNKVLYFLSDVPLNDNLRREYGNSIMCNDNEINFIEDKGEAVNIVLAKLKNYNIDKIGAIGDGAKEFGLFLDVYQRGGYVGVVGAGSQTNWRLQSLLGDNINNIDSVVEAIADLEFSLKCEALTTTNLLNINSEYKGMAFFVKSMKEKPEYLEIKKEKEDRIIELKRLITTGYLCLDDLLNLFYLTNTAKECIFRLPREQKNIQNVRNIINNLYLFGENFSKKVINTQNRLLKQSFDTKKFYLSK